MKGSEHAGGKYNFSSLFLMRWILCDRSLTFVPKPRSIRSLNNGKHEWETITRAAKNQSQANFISSHVSKQA
jgi:hypothetical protein